MATIYIPSLMRDLTGGKEIIHVEGADMRQIIAN
ncbi:MAG: MoaD/ThiS family protein, partial [Gemmatimonadetes bacterium]|nr:MoaD/ThiS family protein [Gemmatimonadota bacterium]